MHSALVIVEKPKSSAGLHQSPWNEVVRTFASAASEDKSIELLSDACALLTLKDQGANALAEMLHCASQSKCPYRVLFFKKPPRWVRTPANRES